MLIIGHRGASGLARENTVRSFKLAQQLKVDMIETDLRLSKKGEIVLSHDPIKKAKHRLTTLDELLEVAKVGLNLEIKEKGLEKQLMQKIKKFSHKVLISSFQPGILKKIRALDENIPLGLIIGSKVEWLLPIKRFIKTLKISSVHLERSLVSQKNVKFLKKLGVEVYAWTVDEMYEFKNFKALKLDGVFTNRPDLIKK